MDAESCDFLLKRDWFVYEEDISDLLWQLNEDDYWTIYDKRKEYSKRVRMMIEPADFRPDTSRLKIKLREVTEEEFAEMERKFSQHVREQMDKEWEDFKKSGGMASRPEQFEDDRIIAIQAMIDAKNALVDSLPRGKRSMEIQMQIFDLKNELLELKENIKELDSFWELEQRIAFDTRNRNAEMLRMRQEKDDNDRMQMQAYSLHSMQKP